MYVFAESEGKVFSSNPVLNALKSGGTQGKGVVGGGVE